MSVNFDLTQIEGFEWDEGNLLHIKIHNVSYTEAEEIFRNQPFFISPDIKHSETEERFQALGVSENGKYIFISFTVRRRKIRVISARNQNKKERNQLLEIGGDNS